MAVRGDQPEEAQCHIAYSDGATCEIYIAKNEAGKVLGTPLDVLRAAVLVALPKATDSTTSGHSTGTT